MRLAGWRRWHLSTRPTKVFCIGFQKTGTTSLRDAFLHWGYRYHGPFGRDWPVERLKADYIDVGLKLAEELDVVADMPWPLMYKELDAAFPGSKFILTMRDTDRWYASIAKHFAGNPASMQQLTYGVEAAAPLGNEARYREVYEAHNQEVREHFADRPGDLLEIWLERGHGWDELGKFLGMDNIPEGDFVRTNTKSQRTTISNRIRGRLSKLGLTLK